MYCSNCGAEISEEARFCYNCGTQLIAVQINTAIDTQMVSEENDRSQIRDPQKKKRKRKWIFRIVVYLILSITLLSFDFTNPFINAFYIMLFFWILKEMVKRFLGISGYRSIIPPDVSAELRRERRELERMADSIASRQGAKTLGATYGTLDTIKFENLKEEYRYRKAEYDRVIRNYQYQYKQQKRRR